MSLNCNEINTILSELEIEGSFIQQIIQPGFDSIALYTYKELDTPRGGSHTILISLGAGACRIHETRKKIPKNEKPLRFNEFLKSRIKGSRIQSCQQIGLERIIKMKLSHGPETFFMFIRLWSGAANIIVTDENLLILDVFFRRPKRKEITGELFTPPEPREEDNNKNFEIRQFNELNTEKGFTGDLQGKTFSELTFNEKVDLWYSEHGESLSREALLEQGTKIYHSRKSRMVSALQRLEAKRQDFLHSEQWKHQGDLILTYGHLIDGQSKYLECEDYDTDSMVRIEINPDKTAHENANVYYEKYKKAVRGLEDLEFDIKKAKKEIIDLDLDYEALCKEPNPIRMQQILRKQNKPKQQIEKKHPGISYTIDGWYILVGRTASENDDLLRKHVKGQDMWMHTRDWPGGYVFIKNRPGKTIPLEILLYAGNLAVYHSKARKAKTADLYYTQVKYLRRAKNGPKGTVLPSQEKNLTITLDDEKLKALESMLNT
jgi:predicted ribosome quality control (RQC) complex YloA/Tae2 family protein